MYRKAIVTTVNGNSGTLTRTWQRCYQRGVTTSSPRGNQGGLNMFRFKLRNARTPDAVKSPRLTPQMVTSILRMNESSVDESYGAVKGFETNSLQANKPIEDRLAHARLVHGPGEMFGVFDGHAGCACAQAVSDRLFSYIGVALADHYLLKAIRDGKIDPTKDLLTKMDESDRIVNSDLAQLHKQSLMNFVTESMAIDNSDMTTKDGLVNAFQRLDKDITMEALPSNLGRAGLNYSCYLDTLSIAFSGAVACAAYVDGIDLLVANVGDSRAVLGVRNDDQWEAVHLSNMHNCDNTAEVDRLLRMHPNESSNIIRNRRLFGDLMPFRSFGDVRYKWSKTDLKHLLNTKQVPNSLISIYGDMLIPRNYRTPPYLDAEPEVKIHRLTPKDKFLVLATDGLWDCLSPDKVVQLVAGHMDGKQVLVNYQPPEHTTLGNINQVLGQRQNSLMNRTLDTNVATHLLRSALGPDHGQVSAQLTLPESIVRFYRDDITIIVIYFDSEYVKDNASPMR